MKKTDSTEKMGTAPVGRLMLMMGIPMILSMVMQAVYNIVDSAFVANMAQNGEAALNALTLAFPFQMLMVAVGIGTGVGMNALAAKSLGCGDSEKAGRAAGNSIFMGIVIYAAFMLFGFFGTESYIGSQTENPVIYKMGVEYLRICCTASFGIVGFALFEKLLQAAGHSVCSTIAQLSGAISNIVLDPIMIYGLLGFPEMGVVGAAYATVIGQAVSLLVGVILHVSVNKSIKLKLEYMKPSLRIIKEIYSIGLPAIIAQALMSLMTYGLNIILMSIGGETGESMVTAYGLYYKIQQFILFAAFGLRDAITPIISYNYGMGSRPRINDGIKYGMGYTIGIMLLGTAVSEIFARSLAGMFGLSGMTEEFCISAIRIISLSIVFAGANIAFQGIFQALNGGRESLVISLLRQTVFVFPVAFAFAYVAKNSVGMEWTVWLTFIIAEALSAAAACLLMRRIYKTKIAAVLA